MRIHKGAFWANFFGWIGYSFSLTAVLQAFCYCGQRKKNQGNQNICCGIVPAGIYGR